MTPPTSITVKGADVEANVNSLETVPAHTFLANLPIKNIERSSIEDQASFLPLHPLQAKANQFLLMLQKAFTEHKAIELSPDHFWLLICQGFAEHIKLNATDFQELIVGTDEKRALKVQRDDFMLNGDNPWEEVIPEFTDLIAKHIHTDLHDRLILDFSTTTLTEKTAFGISFMDTMSRYFDYEVVSMCGIPSIKLEGSAEDYYKILASLHELREYDLAWWLDSVIPSIQKIIETFYGKDNSRFWRSIFKHNNESGGPFITGWITEFFPYISHSLVEENGVLDYGGLAKSEILKTVYVEKPFDDFHLHKVLIKNPVLMRDKEASLTLDEFPGGLSQVPFKWQYVNQPIDMNFIAGFLGITENQAEHRLRAEINWLVNRA